MAKAKLRQGNIYAGQGERSRHLSWPVPFVAAALPHARSIIRQQMRVRHLCSAGGEAMHPAGPPKEHSGR